MHKKQRLSSPIYPGFIEDLSPEDLQNLSEIDAAVSQSDYTVPPLQLVNPVGPHTEALKLPQLTGDKRRGSDPELGSEANNDLVTTLAPSTSIQLTSNGRMQPGPSVSATLASVRMTAANISNDDYCSPSPPPERDDDSRYNTSSTDVPTFVGFQSGSAVNDTGFLGFTSAGKGTSFLPSEDAIEKVKKRMRDWEADIEEELFYMRPQTSPSEATSPRRSITPPRPSPVNPTSSRAISPQNPASTNSAKQKPFKPPLLSNKANLTNSEPSSSNFKSQASMSSFRPPMPSSTVASSLLKPLTPSKSTSGSAFHTPVRLGGAQRPGSVKKFTTPFKPGMRPGELGRVKLQENQDKKKSQERQMDRISQIQMPSSPRKPVYDIPPSFESPSGSRKGKEKVKEYQFFDLS